MMNTMKSNMQKVIFILMYDLTETQPAMKKCMKDYHSYNRVGLIADTAKNILEISYLMSLEKKPRKHTIKRKSSLKNKLLFILS